MESSEFEQLCEETFTNLFNKAKIKNETSFLTSCFVFYKNFNHNILSYTSDFEFQEVIELVEDVRGLRESKDISLKTKSRMYLLIYTHIIEVDLIYTILFNLKNTIRELPYSLVIDYQDENDKKKEATYPPEKIAGLSSELSKIEINIESVYGAFFDKNLRNSFSHSQYYLDPSGDLINSHNIAHKSGGDNKKKVKRLYNFDEIQEKYDLSVIYLKIFIKVYKEFITDYMDGNSYETLFGPIEFDSKHGWAFTRK